MGIGVWECFCLLLHGFGAFSLLDFPACRELIFMVVLLASCAKTHVGFQRTCDVLSQGPDYARCEGIQLFFVCLFVYSKQIFVFFPLSYAILAL